MISRDSADRGMAGPDRTPPWRSATAAAGIILLVLITGAVLVHTGYSPDRAAGTTGPMIPETITVIPVSPSYTPVPPAAVVPPAPVMQASGNLDPAAVETAVHAVVSHVRQVYGLPPLARDAALAGIAREHSREMAAGGYFGHISLRGLDATARGASAGYPCIRDNRTGLSSPIAENLYAASPDNLVLFMNGRPVPAGTGREELFAQMTVAGWMNSSAHRENILDPGLSREGIGVATGAGDLVFVTEDLC